MIKMIGCIQEDGGLGYKGDLLYWFKEDLQHFKHTTEGCKVVMGYNTWASLPKKPLPNRVNYVLCEPEKADEVYDQGGTPIDIGMMYNIFFVSSIVGKDVYVIGGGFVYNQTIEYCDEVILTEVRCGQNKPADTFFPLDKLNELFEMKSERLLIEDVYIVEYVRKDEVE